MVPKSSLTRVEDSLTPGIHVIINSGPFKNLTGIFQRDVTGTDRVIVLVEAQNHQTRIIIDRQMIQRALAI